MIYSNLDYGSSVTFEKSSSWSTSSMQADEIFPKVNKDVTVKCGKKCEFQTQVKEKLGLNRNYLIPLGVLRILMIVFGFYLYFHYFTHLNAFRVDVYIFLVDVNTRYHWVVE